MISLGIHYRKIAHIKYKYEAVKNFWAITQILGYDIDHKYFKLELDGALLIKRGYMCDGCSGVTLDDSSNLHACFLHDPLYQMLRMGKLSLDKKEFDKNRKLADLSFYEQLKLDGMPWFRRTYYYYAVRMFGKKYALPR